MMRLHNSSVVVFIFIDILLECTETNRSVHCSWSEVSMFLLSLLLLLINYESMAENWFCSSQGTSKCKLHFMQHLYNYETVHTVNVWLRPISNKLHTVEKWRVKFSIIYHNDYLLVGKTNRIAYFALDFHFVVCGIYFSVPFCIWAYIRLCLCICNASLYLCVGLHYAPVYFENWHDIIVVQLIQPSTKAIRCRMFSLACSKIDSI